VALRTALIHIHCSSYKCWCSGVGAIDWNISDSIVTTLVSCSLSMDGDSWNSERLDSCFQRRSGVSDRGVWSNLFQSSSQVPDNSWMNKASFSNSFLVQREMLVQSIYLKKYVLSGNILLYIVIYCSTVWNWVISFTPQSLFAPKQTCWYPLHRRLDGPHSWFGWFLEQITLLSLLGLKPQFHCSTACSPDNTPCYVIWSKRK
jgi:hypothetical protein